MKRTLVVVAAVCFAHGCTALPTAECITSDECDAPLVCERGTCVAPDADASDAAADTDAAAGTEGSDTRPDTGDDLAELGDTDSDSDTALDSVGPCEPVDPWTYPVSASGFPGRVSSGTALASHGVRVAVGAPFDDTLGEDVGAVDVLGWTGTGWSTHSMLTPRDATPGEEFGAALALDGDRLVVGAPGRSGEGGIVYNFVWDGADWRYENEAGDDNVVPGNRFGSAVAMDGTTLVVASEGVPGGQVEVFHGWQHWERYRSLLDPNPAVDDAFGAAVAVDGDVVIVGDPLDDGAGEDAGAVVVFRRSNGHWSSGRALDPNSIAAGDRFGCGVALERGLLAVGACGDDTGGEDVGSVTLFEDVDGTWTEVGRLVPEDAGSGLELGSSLRLERDRVAMAGRALEGAPAVFVYERGETPTEWNLMLAHTVFAASNGDPVQVGGGWGRLVVANGTDATLRGMNRCEGAAHGPCCLDRCDDARRGSDEVDVDWGGPCASPEGNVLFAWNADNHTDLGERFLIEDVGFGDSVGIVPVMGEGDAYFAHARWVEFEREGSREAGVAATRLTPRAEVIPRDHGFEMLFDVVVLNGNTDSHGYLQFQWPGTEDTWGWGLGRGIDGVPAIQLGRVGPRAHQVDPVLSVPHASLRTRIPVRARLQVGPGRARMKVWAATSSEPDEWIDLPAGDYLADGEFSIVLGAEGANSGSGRFRTGSFVVRDLPYYDDDPTDPWFPPRLEQGADRRDPPPQCVTIRELDRFRYACNYNTADGYYWELDLENRLGDYGFNGLMTSALQPRCDEDNVGHEAMAGAWDSRSQNPAEYVCRVPGDGPPVTAKDCPGVDGDIFESGRGQNGIFPAVCRAW